jgi:hypothetical protein
MSDTAEIEFQELKKSILNFLTGAKGHVKFEALDSWSREHALPRLTLRIAINDLIDAGILTGSPTLYAGDDYAPWVKIPSELSIKGEAKPTAVPAVEVKSPPTSKAMMVAYDETEPNLRRAIEYLNDYPSVGIMRFNLDLQSLQVVETDRILKKLSDEGFVEVSPLGVVNATPQLPKMTRNVTLGDLIASKT